MMEQVMDFVMFVKSVADEHLREHSPALLVVGTLFATYILLELKHRHLDEFGLRKRVVTWFFSTVKSIPIVKNKIDSELATVKVGIEEGLKVNIANRRYYRAVPAISHTAEEILRLAESYDQVEGPHYLQGRVSGAVFNREEDETERQMYETIFGMFAWSNPLWPKLFPGIRIMEDEVVRMCCTMLHGDEDTCGTMSSGGSMSILLACLAHRNRLLRKGEKYTEMVIPSTAHAAFFKAAEVFRIKVQKISVDKSTCKVNIREMKEAINSRTCMLVGSAPNFPYGSIDDIEAIGKLGLENDIPVHVDACLGGFILPFLEEDYKFDFRVPGVSSISADTHKYGLAPKGSSVVLYRNKELLHNQYFCESEWQGGIYASPTLEGSRAGQNIALCWAAMLYHAEQDYVENARKVQETTRKIRDGLANIPGIILNGASDVCIVSWTTEDEVPLYRFHNYMKNKKWQLNGLQFPAGVHIMVTLLHTHPGLAEEFIQDCKEAVSYVRNSPVSDSDKNCEAAIYGFAQSIPDRSLVTEFANIYLDAVYTLPDDAVSE